jgi:hypothetical protein
MPGRTAVLTDPFPGCGPATVCGRVWEHQLREVTSVLFIPYISGLSPLLPLLLRMLLLISAINKNTLGPNLFVNNENNANDPSTLITFSSNVGHSHPSTDTQSASHI